MSERIRVGVFPADEGGCGHYRMIWPWTEVARQFTTELDVTIIGAKDAAPIHLMWTGGKFDDFPTEYHVPHSIVGEVPFDVVVFQRPLHVKYVETFRLLRERGVVVIVDIDDNFDRIDTRNTAWFPAEPHWMHKTEVDLLARLFGSVTVTKRSTLGDFMYVPDHVGAANRKNIRAALRHADLLITSTPELAAHYGGLADNTIVLDNCVNEWYLTLGERHVDNDTPIIGWTGSVATHPGDLDVMGGALQAMRRKGVDFRWSIVGTGKGTLEAVGIDTDETTRGWVDLNGPYQQAYTRFDVAVCPLTQTPFNEAKSWLKPLEAAALGVVPVMSPLAEYRRIHARGIGFIAKRPRDWERWLTQLTRDAGLRAQMREDGLAAARELTYQKNAPRWVEALNTALVSAQGRQA